MYQPDGNEVSIKSKRKHRFFKGRAIIKRHGQPTSNNVKKKINMFHSGIPKIHGVTTFGQKAE